MPLLVLIFGALTIISLITKTCLERFSLPPILGYLLIGGVLAVIDRKIPLMNESGETVLSFLSAIGIIILLFKVGIESDIHALLEELPKASVIWLPAMIISGVPAYYITRYLLDYSLIPSLFTGVAMTATSVGVSLAVWEDTGKMGSREGDLLLDTAELDDISGVALMALLFSIAPVLREFSEAASSVSLPVTELVQTLFIQAGLFGAKFLIFVFLVVLAGRFLEQPLLQSARKIGNKATVLIFVIGIGFIIAGTAGLIGLSLPVGALLAGLLLSRHRRDYGVEPFYQSIYLFFIPYFFIHIGFQVDPSLVTASFGSGLILVVVAVLGKVVGVGIFSRLFTTTYGAFLISVSMVPRAEIAMVIIQRGSQLGEWAMPDDLYAAMVQVCSITCLGTTLLLHWALRRE
mgnify:CR=1 FL=1